METSKLYEKLGQQKIEKALNEVASGLTAATEDLRPLLDRAYEIGFEADESGLVTLDSGLVLGDGTPIGDIIDVGSGGPALEGEPVGLLDDEAESDESELTPGFGMQAASSSYSQYRWIRFTNSGGGRVTVRSFDGARRATHRPGTYTIRQLMLYRIPSGLKARTYYQNPVGLRHYWSTFRPGATTATRTYTFSRNVYGSIAQIA